MSEELPEKNEGWAQDTGNIRFMLLIFSFRAILPRKYGKLNFHLRVTMLSRLFFLNVEVTIKGGKGNSVEIMQYSLSIMEIHCKAQI